MVAPPIMCSRMCADGEVGAGRRGVELALVERRHQPVERRQDLVELGEGVHSGSFGRRCDAVRCQFGGLSVAAVLDEAADRIGHAAIVGQALGVSASCNLTHRVRRRLV